MPLLVAFRPFVTVHELLRYTGSAPPGDIVAAVATSELARGVGLVEVDRGWVDYATTSDSVRHLGYFIKGLCGLVLSLWTAAVMAAAAWFLDVTFLRKWSRQRLFVERCVLSHSLDLGVASSHLVTVPHSALAPFLVVPGLQELVSQYAEPLRVYDRLLLSPLATVAIDGFRLCRLYCFLPLVAVGLMIVQCMSTIALVGPGPLLESSLHF